MSVLYDLDITVTTAKRVLVLLECFVAAVSGLLVFQAQQHLGWNAQCCRPGHGPPIDSLLDCIISQHVCTTDCWNAYLLCHPHALI